MTKKYISIGVVLLALGAVVWKTFGPGKTQRIETGPTWDNVLSPQASVPDEFDPNPDKVGSVKTNDKPGQSGAGREDSFSSRRRLMAADRMSHIQRNRLRIEERQGRLFGRLRGLPSDKLEALKELMAAEDVERNLAIFPRRENETSEETQQHVAQMSVVDAEYEEKIRDLLGDEDYRKYAAFQQSFAYQDTVEQITNIMRAQGGGTISNEQQDIILDAYARAINTAAQVSSNEFSPQATAEMTDIQRQELKGIQLARFDEYLSAELSKVLDAETFKQFMSAEYAQESGH